MNDHKGTETLAEYQARMTAKYEACAECAHGRHHHGPKSGYRTDHGSRVWYEYAMKCAMDCGCTNYEGGING